MAPHDEMEMRKNSDLEFVLRESQTAPAAAHFFFSSSPCWPIQIVVSKAVSGETSETEKVPVAPLAQEKGCAKCSANLEHCWRLSYF